MNGFNAIGKRTRLVEGREKVTGAARYATDVYLPGMLFARILPSPYAHATVKSIDKSAALDVPGVYDVLTHEDLPDIVPESRQRLLLARGRVIFVGQPVALVLAESETAAADALELVQVEYEILPAAITIEQALAADAPLVWPDGVPKGAADAAAHGAEGGDEDDDKDEGNIADRSNKAQGDVEAAFAEADIIVEHTFTSPMVHQSPLEPQGVIVQPDPVTGGATVWVSTQGAFNERQYIADILDIPDSSIQVNGMTVGGAFGSKLGLITPLVAVAANVTGRTVRWTLTRMEEMSAGNPAPPIIVRAKLGAKSDGTLVAVEGEAFLDSGCYPSHLVGIISFVMTSFYRIPNYKVDATEVMTFKQSAGAYRAPCAPTATFVMDTLIDEIAEKLGLDPLDMRLKNLARRGDPMSNGKTWPTTGVIETLEALRDHPVWQNRAQAKAEGRGVGLAVGGWMGGVEPAAAACALSRDGFIQVHVGHSDISGTDTSMILLAAEAIGVEPDSVRLVEGDTRSNPYSGVAGGSKTMYTTGAAVVKAAESARQQILEIAAEEFEAAVEDLEIVNGAVQVRGMPSSSISLKRIAEKTMDFNAKYAPVFAHGRTAIRDQSPAFSAQLAEVEVDQETGTVMVQRLIIAQDVGRAINPLAIEGQMMGGATQGVGWALHEEMVYDASGQLLSGSWMDYSIPDATQAPPNMETIILEIPSEHGPFGARGVGEPPVVPTAAAVANAIAHAAGIRCTDLPMTPVRVFRQLQATNGAS